MRFHHGDRVRLGGFDGFAGVVRQCEKRDGSGVYFRVQLRDGSWRWPDGAVVESSGPYELTCQECDGRFRSDTLTEVFCPNCDRRGTHRPGSTSFGYSRQLLRGNATPAREVTDDDSPF